MKSNRPLRLKTFFLISVMVLAGPLGNVLLGRGMKHVGPVTAWPPAMLFHLGLKIFSSPSIWLGIASLLTFFVANILVLTFADYSFVQPASSIAYAVVALLGYLLLGESVSPLRWLGIVIICTGVFAVGRTDPRSSPQFAEESGDSAVEQHLS